MNHKLTNYILAQDKKNKKLKNKNKKAAGKTNDLGKKDNSDLSLIHI